MKKGFTLIELLAVIVILAIIALIVTPVVSNIVSNARISANARSVEGHIRNIELAIISEAFISTSTGDMDSYDILTDGPTIEGRLSIPNNDVVKCTSYSIKHGTVLSASGCKDSDNKWGKTYNYTNTGGAVVEGSGSGSESGVPTAFIYDSKEKSNSENSTPKSLTNAVVGDYVKIGEEGFYIIEKQSTKTLLLTELSLKNFSVTDGNEWRQGTCDDEYEHCPYTNAFSPTIYWITEEQAENYDYFVYDENGQPIEAYVYNSNNPRIYPIIENYKTFLLESSDKILDARLMSVEEAINAGYSANYDDYDYSIKVFNQSCVDYTCDSFWLGNISADNGGMMFIAYGNVISDNTFFDDEDGCGIRPIIEISNDAF